MHVIILGSGRVGSAIARDLVSREHEVTVIDRDPDSLLRLGGDAFPGQFEIGEGLDTGLLERAGLATADAFVAATSDDNINVVVAQIAQRKYDVDPVVVRVLDPEKAEFYSRRGLRVVCPTRRAISEMIAAVERDESGGRADAGTSGQVAQILGELTRTDG
jgi:trk system potassium uptake protein TrkA